MISVGDVRRKGAHWYICSMSGSVMYSGYFAEDIRPIHTNMHMGETSSGNRKQGILETLEVRRKDQF